MDKDLESQIESISTRVAEEVYKRLGTSFGVAKIPIHLHNGTDAPNIPPTSVAGFAAITGAPGGVISTGLLNTQTVNDSVQKPPAVVYSYPMNIIYGFGVGIHSAFNGGTAPEGSQIVFTNAGATGQLWIRIAGLWYGVNLDLTPIA